MADVLPRTIHVGALVVDMIVPNQQKTVDSPSFPSSLLPSFPSLPLPSARNGRLVEALEGKRNRPKIEPRIVQDLRIWGVSRAGREGSCDLGSPAPSGSRPGLYRGPLERILRPPRAGLGASGRRIGGRIILSWRS